MKKICDFCGTEESENNLILESNSNICESCAVAASFFLSNIRNISDDATQTTIPLRKTPKDYKKLLDDYVIGQDNAKEVLSVAIYNHVQRIENPDSKIDKSNVMFIGPTGAGKTLLAETIAKHLDIPLAIVNTTSLTAAGYIGEDVSSVLERLWRDSGEDVEKAENGIIFLDEIDKNATAGGGTNNKDVSGKAVQQELLKILEGDKVKIYPEGSSKNRKSGSSVEINTKNILFIAGGAFVGIKDKPGVQINALGKDKNKNSDVPDTKMLIKFGMIPELIGRFPMIAELQEITLEDMKKIMTEPKDSIVKQYKQLFKLSDVELNYDEKALNSIAKISLTKDTGARGLRNVMENIMLPYMFSIDEYKNKEINMTHSYNKFKVSEIVSE